MRNLLVRLYLWAQIGLTWFAYHVTGHATLHNFAVSSILAAFVAPVALLPFALLRLASRPTLGGSGLDQVLFHFPSGDPFYLRHLLTSLCVFGRIGGGKSSSSGLFFARKVLRVNSSGLILASNPDDAKWWKERFSEAGRLDDLIVFSKDTEHRWNFLAELQRSKADAREITDFLVIAGECLVESKGKEDLYWKQISERMLYNVISALMYGGYAVSAGAIANFLGTAAFSAEQLKSDQFKEGFCNEVLEKVVANAQGSIAQGDAAMLVNYWKGSFVYLDDRPRSSAMSAVENITHCLSVGYARELFATKTTVSCKNLEHGKWILMDFPVSANGATAKLIYSCAKLAVQKMVLKNNWSPDQPITVLWADEAWHVVNSGDRNFLAESRKHGGVLVYLTQSVLNFKIVMGGKEDAKADSLLGMFGTLIVHAADVDTAKYMVEMVGEEEQEETGGSYTPSVELADALSGKSQFTGSFSVKRLSILTTRMLTAGMRMGGKSKIVDAWVYRPELFSTGSNILRMEFKQD